MPSIISINQPSAKPKKDVLDKIAQGFQIAQGVLGTGLAIPEFIQKRKATEQAMDLAEKKDQREEAGLSLDVATETRPAEVVGKPPVATLPGGGVVQSIAPKFEPGATEIPGHGMRAPLEGEDSKTRFGAFRSAVKTALDNGFVFVERDGELKPVSPEAVRDGEDILDDFGEVLLSDERIKQRQRQMGVVLREESFEDSKMRAGRKEREGIIKEVRGDSRKRLDKIDDSIDEMISAAGLLKADSTISEFGLGRVLAKGVFGESGRLTDQDVLQFIPGSAEGSAQAVVNWFMGRPTGKLTPPQQDAIKRTLSEMMKAKRLQRSAMAYETLQEVRANKRLLGSDELSDFEASTFSRYGDEETLAAAKEIKDLRIKLATTNEEDQLKFKGEVGSWREFSKAADVMQNMWLRNR